MKIKVKQLQKLAKHLRDNCPPVVKCPVWPKYLRQGAWDTSNKKSCLIATNRDINVFFGITEKQRQHLFVPCKQDVAKYGGKNLNDKVTTKQVANQIDSFIKKVAA